MRFRLTAMLITLAACAGGGAATGELPLIDVAALEQRLQASPRPVVINVWASWCLPCRSEAPLLKEAHETYGDRVEFIGVDVEDSQAGARQFLSEFELDFDHLFDPHRELPQALGGFGTPITYFFAPEGRLVRTHSGAIDKEGLISGIEEILGSGSTL